MSSTNVIWDMTKVHYRLFPEYANDNECKSNQLSNFSL